MNGLSILIPTFNDECTSLVEDLLAQCSGNFEIIVADDGSTDESVITANKTINSLPHCRFILRGRNAGRAAIRNFLAGEAQYDELLFIDSDMTVIRKDFIRKYLRDAKRIADRCADGEQSVIYGGYDVPQQNGLSGNLRYRYERSCRMAHTADKRRKNPYADFHTSNFMVPRAVMMAHPLDEEFRNYGYEDVAYGEELREAGVGIYHIDNPMGFCRFEENNAFLRKTEEGLRTLWTFCDKLHDYSRLITIIGRFKKLHLCGILRNFLTPFIPSMQKNLVGNKPSLKLFALYKISYFLNLEK